MIQEVLSTLLLMHGCFITEDAQTGSFVPKHKDDEKLKRSNQVTSAQSLSIDDPCA
jgi:hypothetical protein